ncbi:MAG: FAD-dependent hydroxylase [Leptolyngbya sp.]|nr:FAD-dependent hydroxylase [Leptolyngbya sp.]
MTAILPSPIPSQSSSLPPLSVDIAIVGGGIVGLTLAAALRSSGLRVAVVEAQTPEGAASRQRAYAFSPTSVDIMKGLGLWPQIGPQICHFQQVRLSDGDHPEVVRFSPQDLGDDSVFYGAEHSVLMTALQGAVQAAANIHYLSESTLTVTERHGERVIGTLTTLDGTRTLDAALVVAADGKQSPLRRQANIDAFGWQYWQSCITTVLEPEGDHQHTAYERFWPSGPFAILPLPGGRCQVVWTSPHEEAQAILKLPEAEFMAELERRYGPQMGKLKRLTPPALFPVQLMQCNRYIQPRLALVGDAAHSCHPVGGQGLNMGLRDAAALAEVLTAAHHRGEDLGSTAVLRRYERWRRWENWVILSFTDTLTRSFSNQIFPIVALRRLGLWMLNHVPLLRHLALRLMTGRLGRVPKLAQEGRRSGHAGI